MFKLPDFLVGVVSPDDYLRWLNRRARAHSKRDRDRSRRRGQDEPYATASVYRDAIHRAVVSCGGVDDYTGEAMQWELIGTWNNTDAQREGSVYKRRFARMPTVDHFCADDRSPMGITDLRICSWEVNDAKNDLSLEDFRTLCRRVLAL